jgi:HK97 family phage portal protein
VTALRTLFDRNIEDPHVPLTGASLVDFLDSGFKNEAGVRVNETSVLGLSGVWRSVQLISSLGGSLPLKTYRKGTRERAVVRLIENPHPDLTPFELWQLTYVHRLLWGNAYLYKQRNDAGMVINLLPIAPEAVKVGRVKADPALPSGKIFEITMDDGSTVPWTPSEVLHLPGLGYDGVCGASPIRIAKNSYGVGLAAEQYAARFFGSGSLMAGILQTEQRLEDDDARKLKERWKRSVAGLRKSHEIAVLGSGAKFQPVSVPNTDAQFLESRQFQIEEQARWFGVPPFMLFALEKSTSWGTGIEQQAIGFVVFSLSPTWLVPTEQRITREATPPNVYAKYNVEGLLRGDSAARGAFYRTMREIGAFNADDVRELEERPPLPNGEGQEYLRPTNLTPMGVTPNAQPAAG